MIFLIISLLLPFIVSLVLRFLPNALRFSCALGVAIAVFLSNIFLSGIILKYQSMSFGKNIFNWFGISFFVDGFSIFISLLLWLTVVLFILALEHTKGARNEGTPDYSVVLLCAALAQAIFFSAYLSLLFLFLLAEIFLPVYFRPTSPKAIITPIVSAGLFLTALILLYVNTATLHLEFLKSSPVNNIIAFLILAVVLLRQWQAVLLSKKTSLSESGFKIFLTTVISIYLFVRLLCISFVSSRIFLDVTLILAVVIIIAGALFAFAEKSIKKILIYAVVSQSGFLLLAFCQPNIISFRIALLYTFSQTLGLIGLFLGAVLIESRTRYNNVEDYAGLLKSMPYTSIGFLLCAFSLIGIPPFLGFWPKLFTTVLSVQEGHIMIEAFASIGALLTLFYLMRLFNRMFLGENKNSPQEKKSSLLWITFGLGVTCLILGLFVRIPFNFIEALIR